MAAFAISPQALEMVDALRLGVPAEQVTDENRDAICELDHAGVCIFQERSRGSYEFKITPGGERLIKDFMNDH